MRVWLAAVLFAAALAVGATAPIGQLTFMPVVVLTITAALVLASGLDDAQLGIIEVRTINAAPEDYPEWSWPTEKDHPWLSERRDHDH